MMPAPSDSGGDDDGIAHLPAHIVETIEAVGKLHDSHERRASRTQRIVERATAAFARPRTVLWITALCATWIAFNVELIALHRTAPDPPPFQWLQGALALVAVYLTCMILTTQRRADTLASHRAQLTLELAILAEQKSAKTIALLEELRRDHPQLADRVDADADAMSAPSDPKRVLDAIVERAAVAESSDEAVRGNDAHDDE